MRLSGKTQPLDAGAEGRMRGGGEETVRTETVSSEGPGKKMEDGDFPTNFFPSRHVLEGTPGTRSE
jgi:hypothetical protein